MLGQDNLRTVVKENLRGVRFLARELKSSVLSAERHNRWIPEPAVALTSAVAEFSDTALTRLEAAALGFVSADPATRSASRAARSLADYFPASPFQSAPQSESLFARDQYAAAKAVLTERGSANPSVSELAMSQAYRRAAAKAEGADPIRLAAETALAIAAVRPVAAPARIVEEETGTVRDANRFVAAVLGLALAVASTSSETASAAEILHASATAVDIGWPEVDAAFAPGKATADEIEHLFREWSPRLP